MGKHWLFVGVMAIAASPAGAGIIDFNGDTLDPLRGQHGGGTATVLDGGATLELSGNTWRVLDYSAAPIEVTADTVIAFDFRADRVGEIAGVMLGDRVTSGHGFRVIGTQNWGNPVEGYTDADVGDWRSVVVRVGEALEGRTFDSLTFISDHDRGARDQLIAFRDVTVVNPEPASLALLGLSAVVLARGRSHRRN